MHNAADFNKKNVKFAWQTMLCRLVLLATGDPRITPFVHYNPRSNRAIMLLNQNGLHGKTFSVGIKLKF